MTNRVLNVQIITGPFTGEMVFVPRIMLSTTADQLPFEFHRQQFPVKLAFAMTINKSQGHYPVFSHGQLGQGACSFERREQTHQYCL